MARLVANLPILVAGMPPLTINSKKRKEYMILMGEYSIARGDTKPDEDLVKPGKEYKALVNFFKNEWNASLDIVKDFLEKQKLRDS